MKFGRVVITITFGLISIGCVDMGIKDTMGDVYKITKIKKGKVEKEKCSDYDKNLKLMNRLFEESYLVASFVRMHGVTCEDKFFSDDKIGNYFVDYNFIKGGDRLDIKLLRNSNLPMFLYDGFIGEYGMDDDVNVFDFISIDRIGEFLYTDNCLVFFIVKDGYIVCVVCDLDRFYYSG